MMISLFAVITTATLLVGVSAYVIATYRRSKIYLSQKNNITLADDEGSRELAENLLSDFNDLLKTSTQINEGINELRLESQTTMSAIAIISRLADQTKLLALNANKATSDERLTLINDEFRELASQFIQASSQLQEILSRLNGGATDLLVLSEHNQHLSQLTFQHVNQKIPLNVSSTDASERGGTTSTTQVKEHDE